MEAYNCELFNRQDKWYLTMERPLVRLDEEAETANVIAGYILQNVKKWHDGSSLIDANLLKEIRKSQVAWKELLYILGLFRFRLKQVDLEFDEKSNSLVHSEDGIPFETWAVSCESLPDYVRRCKQWIATGQFDYDSEDDLD